MISARMKPTPAAMATDCSGFSADRGGDVIVRRIHDFRRRMPSCLGYALRVVD